LSLRNVKQGAPFLEEYSAHLGQSSRAWNAKSPEERMDEKNDSQR
jgi:hypothetical protein